jgi:formate--tetrahydrofolate ligase
MALAYADWVVTEAGFGFDLGAEKFFDIKCVSAGLDTAAVVLVATVRALKLHGGADRNALTVPDPGAVERGVGNLRKHIESIRTFGERPVVALNRFANDIDEEIAVIAAACDGWQVPFAVTEHYQRGGEGAIDLARTVLAHVEACAQPFRPLYDWTEPVKVKMDRIARAMYGASEVAWTREAEQDLALAAKLGCETLPLCVAKTQKSLSDDPRKIGRPEDFEITVRNVIIAAGAGYLVPVLGEILRMPGLPASPQAERVDLVNDRIVGVAQPGPTHG